MLNAKIEFQIKLNAGMQKGQIVHITTDIEELEEDDVSTLLIDQGYLDSWCNNGEYKVLGRSITVIDE